jgi:hypothetical protein
MRGGGAERLNIRRFRHLIPDPPPSADRWVELFPKTVALLRTIQPLHTEPGKYVFTTNEGKPIEAKALASRSASRWIRPRGRS